MTKLILGIFAVLVTFLPVHSQSDSPDLLKLARLHGVAFFVLEDKVIEDEIIEKIRLLDGSGQDPDFNLLIERMIPDAPKPNYSLIDTAGLLLNAKPYQLINDSVFTAKNRDRLQFAILGKSGKVKGDQKDLRVIEYPNNPELAEIDSTDVIRSFLRLWSSINYYYPYKDELPQHWDSVFLDYLPIFLKASRAENRAKQYNMGLHKLSAEINDSHVRLSEVFDKRAHNQAHRQAKKDKKAARKTAKQSTDTTEKKWMLFPVRFKAIDSCLYIAKLFPCAETEGLEIGDQVESINDWSVPQMQARYDELYANSNSVRRNFEMNRRNSWKSFTKRDTMRLKLKEVEADPKIMPKVEVTLSEYNSYLAPQQIKSPENEAGLVYLKISDDDKGEFKSKLKKSAKEDLPLIIDARDYPSGLFITLIPKYLSKKSQATASFYSSSTRYPGVYAYTSTYHMFFSNTADMLFKMLRIYPTHWQPFIPLVKTIDAPVVVLIDEATMSWGETTVMSIAAHKKENLTLIGRNTAGANGNIGLVQLAGQKELSFTRVIINDQYDQNYQRQGIPPDVYVAPSIPTPDHQDQDLILQTALDFLREQEKQAVME